METLPVDGDQAYSTNSTPVRSSIFQNNTRLASGLHQTVSRYVPEHSGARQGIGLEPSAEFDTVTRSGGNSSAARLPVRASHARAPLELTAGRAPAPFKTLGSSAPLAPGINPTERRRSNDRDSSAVALRSVRDSRSTIHTGGLSSSARGGWPGLIISEIRWKSSK